MGRGGFPLIVDVQMAGNSYPLILNLLKDDWQFLSAHPELR